MYKNILVPIDLAHVREGKDTLEIARANLEEGGHVTLLNVIEDIPKWAAAQLPKGTIERSMKHAEEQLKAICEKCGGTGSRGKGRKTCPNCQGRGQVQFRQGVFTINRTSG